MKTDKLFSTYKLGNILLNNRIVMAPMTRSRAVNNLPNDLMALYYKQRSGAGLIITEGTSPSPNGLGYTSIPGIFSQEQVKGWSVITEVVHKEGSKIFVQLMHTGRVGHPENLPAGAELLAPSALASGGKIWTYSNSLKAIPAPREITLEDINTAKAEFVKASQNAIAAGFDGVELHGANGYLLEQFLSPLSNQRTDKYGGSIENRVRFIIETAGAVAEAIGKDKTAIRLSPYGTANGLGYYDELEIEYEYLVKELDKLGILYIHLVDHSSMGSPEVPVSIKKNLRSLFSGTLILSGGYETDRAEKDLEDNSADLIAFGRQFINNPDFVDRLRHNYPISDKIDTATFYSGGEKGYIDYPVYSQEVISA
jgi:N-ethylmaleimide reductase